MHQLQTSLFCCFLWLYSPLLDLGRFSVPCSHTQLVGLLGRGKQTQYKRTQTYISWVGFEPTIPAFERAETVHALDRAGTVIGKLAYNQTKMSFSQNISYIKLLCSVISLTRVRDKVCNLETEAVIMCCVVLATALVLVGRADKLVSSNGTMMSSRGKSEKLGKNPAPVSLCTLPIWHVITRERTRGSTVRSQSYFTS
jgi:hypothetical protein